MNRFLNLFESQLQTPVYVINIIPIIPIVIEYTTVFIIYFHHSGRLFNNFKKN